MIARAWQALVEGGAFAAGAAIVVAHPTSAQGHRLEIAPAIGAYAPTRQLPSYPWVGYPDCGECAKPRLAQQNRAVAVGGHVTAWLGNWGGIEGSLMYAPSGVDVHSGSVVAAGLRAVLSIAPKAPTTSVLFMGGPAIIHRSGSYYYDVAPVRGTKSLGGAFGLGLDIHPGRRFGIRATIEDYLYSVQFASGTSFYSQRPSERRVQQDFVLSLSITPFARPRTSR